tara:strand:+ start:1475 stop:3127 length:1653 start_codon:yes stop_codon:yes gene_type:complete
MIKKYLGVLLVISLLIPIVLSAEIFEYQESDLVSIKTNAEDPDNDPLSISYGPPLDKNGEWQTNYGDAGNYTVTVTVSDGETEVSDEISLIILRKNTAPTFDSTKPSKSSISISENDDLTFSVKATDPNKDDISYTWFLDEDFVSDKEEYTLGTNYNSEGNYTVSVKISDSELEATHEWKIKVDDFNTKPRFERISFIEVEELNTVSLNLKATDIDGDDITFTSPNLPEGSSLNGNVFRWTTSYDTVKPDSFGHKILQNFRFLSKTYRVKFVAESRDKTTQRIASIKVSDINRAPVLDELQDIVVNEGETVLIEPSASDPDENKIKYSYSGWINSNKYTPGFEEQGIYYVKVTATDGILQDSNFVKITVNNVNRPPIFEDIKSRSVSEGEQITISLKSSDPDSNNLIYTISDPPQNSTLIDNIFKWTPAFDIATKNSELITLDFTVSDGESTETQSNLVEVFHKNRPPKIINTSEDNVEVKLNKEILFFVDAIDLDGDDLVYNWEFSAFSKYATGSKHKRIFTSKGNKKIIVKINDGKEEISHEWNIKVV